MTRDRSTTCHFIPPYLLEKVGATDALALDEQLRLRRNASAAEPRSSAARAVDVAAWVATGAVSRIDTDDDPTLTARRTWRCYVPRGPAVIPCGGTHVPDLSHLPRVTVEYRPTDEGFEQVTALR